MNLFQKIWTSVREFFPSRQKTDKKLISSVEKVWGNSKEKNEVIEIIQNVDDKASKAKLIAIINQIEKEIKSLEIQKETINKRLAKIAEINISNNNKEIDESYNKIKQLIETKTISTSSRFFISDSQKLDNLLKSNNLLKQFKERENDRKRKEELHKKQIRVKLESISILIGQDKLDEAKIQIAQIQKQIKNSYKHELERLSTVQQKLKEKELQILKKQHEEAQRKRDEEIKRLKEIDERQQEEERKRKEQHEREEREQQEKLRKLREVEDKIREERQQVESSKRRENDEKERQAKAKLENLLIKKHNWQEFQQVLQQNGISILYHFTDKANLKSIKENGGLYSWQYCDRSGIDIPFPGGGTLSRQLDCQYGLQDYVRVSFTEKHPMMFFSKKEGRIQNPVILKISLDVAYFANTRFANMNATKTGHRQGVSLDDLKAIHFETVKLQNHFDLDDSEKSYYQAELLIKTWIPIEYITNINNFQ
jgi:hypothetical protein